MKISFGRLSRETYELGPKPTSSVTATYASNKITITVTEGSTSIQFVATITPPASSSTKGPYPAFIPLGGASIPIPSHVALISFNNEEIAATNPRAQGKFYTLYGKTHPAGGLMAWAWGVSRVIDALEKLPASTTNIDTTRLGVTGCSRNGKGAMIAGAFDDRIQLTIPQEPGSGGSGSWRIVAEMKKNGTTVEDATQIVQGDGWFATEFEKYVNNVNVLPFDHHMLSGLIAPRGLLIIENSGIDYLGPVSSYGCAVAAQLVYGALGVKDHLGFSQASHGTSHCQMPSSQQGDLTAFINSFLLNKTGVSTDVFKTDGKFTFDVKRWVDWTAATLT
ncbi:hypothetical protein CPB83DRAFT_907213 [Crepidotus variabilis]|uniref:(4-O-methyl)-D-glucuronate--lignin esterase n=1 Tax=Crepidotus variabilis TaxID=179855 RepID=A0A9P6EEJ9_9AGAR|nr:hypothetical protein CPB83DRAFT_907213 [Crepidotus variabilis]